MNDKTLKRLYFYSLLFFAVLLPFQFKWLPLTLGMMFYALIWLLSLGFIEKLKRVSANFYALLLLAYVLWVALGAVYTHFPAEAARLLTLKLPFAVWPLLLGSVYLFKKKHREQLVMSFIYAVMAAVMLSFGESLVRYLDTGDTSYWYFGKLINFDMVPPHYFGMYVNFAYAVIFYRFLNRKYLLQRKWLSLLFLLVFLVTIVLVSVRMQYLVFAVVNFAGLFIFKNPVSTKVRVAWTSFALLALTVLALLLPGSRKRVVDTVNEIISFEEMVNNKQTNPRKFIWQEGWQVVKENFWWGTGTGGEDAALQDNLENVNAKFWDGSRVFYLRERGYNYHNTYLQHWAAHGIVGFLLLVSIIFIPLFRKATPTETKLFLLVCAISFITESMMQRQAGVLFFSFFYAIFLIVKPVDTDSDASRIPI